MKPVEQKVFPTVILRVRIFSFCATRFMTDLQMQVGFAGFMWSGSGIEATLTHTHRYEETM